MVLSAEMFFSEWFFGGTGFSGKITCLKGRDFEVLSCGGLYLTTFDWELARAFRVGEEVLCYQNIWDCVEQIKYYLRNPEEARQIANAGRERILKEHTWTNRMATLLRWMGLLEG